MSEIVNEKTQEWSQWFWHHVEGVSGVHGRWKFTEKATRGLIILGETILPEIEALRGKGQRFPMSRELISLVEQARSEYNRNVTNGLGDLRRRQDFVLDILKKVMRAQEILAKELDAVQRGWGGKTTVIDGQAN